MIDFKDVLVLISVFGLLAFAVVFYFVRRKKGKGGCGGNCSSCRYSCTEDKKNSDGKD